jgi:hypothetical protein
LHAGAAVGLLVLDAEHGIQSHGDTFTLVGLTSDGRAGAESIAAILARGAHVTHIIEHPRSLHVELLWESRTVNLQVVAEDGTRTVITLGPPVLGEATGSRTEGLRTSPRPRGLLRAGGVDPSPTAPRMP